MKSNNSINVTVAIAGILVGAASLTFGETWQPANWTNDPLCHNPNYGLVGAQTASPCFTNNGIQSGTLYASSPIGKALSLTKQGETITLSGELALTGSINRDGNMQFRIGLLQQGKNTGDTNWLGYLFGNATGGENPGSRALFIRNNPNPGVFGSCSTGNAMRPACDAPAYTSGWSDGAYSFALSVTRVAPGADRIAWKLNGIPPNAYVCSGVYTNTFALTMPSSFDQVGIMAGAALFNSPSAANSVSLKNLKITFETEGATR